MVLNWWGSLLSYLIYMCKWFSWFSSCFERSFFFWSTFGSTFANTFASTLFFWGILFAFSLTSSTWFFWASSFTMGELSSWSALFLVASWLFSSFIWSWLRTSFILFLRAFSSIIWRFIYISRWIFSTGGPSFIFIISTGFSSRRGIISTLFSACIFPWGTYFISITSFWVSAWWIGIFSSTWTISSICRATPSWVFTSIRRSLFNFIKFFQNTWNNWLQLLFSGAVRAVSTLALSFFDSIKDLVG